MTYHSRGLVVIVAALAMIIVSHTASGQKSGGTLRTYDPDSPGGMSMLEETTIYADGPLSGVFNNLVMFDEHVPQNSLTSVIPELATSWRWSQDATTLTLALRQGVKWHDGQPFTALDVKCTWDLLMGTGPQQLRLNPRKSYYDNLTGVTINGDWEVAFHLNRPQPAFLMLLAESRAAAIYPCHVSPAQMRQHPIGTGPFRFVEFKPNENIRLVRNPDYWKQDRPYLDGIDYTIIKDQSTATLAFIAGKFDITFPHKLLQISLMKNIESQIPQAICELDFAGGDWNLLINYHQPPFDNPQLRRAMMLTLDRKAFVDIITRGYGKIGGVLQPPPEGLWGLTPEQVQKLAADNARPILFHLAQATCRQPYVKGLTIMTNSQFNGWRMEDVWLDK
jgi:peptide/nickel transport system substrate-binding protein